jgi:hypothetical protein
VRVSDVERSQVRIACSATLPLMTTERSHAAQTSQEISSKSHLRLKEGISIYRTPIGLRCGTARSSFAIPEKGYVRALEILSSSNVDEIDIPVACGITSDEFRELVWSLEEHEFLETSPSILSVTTRFQSVAKHKRRDILPDAAFSQLQKRVAPNFHTLVYFLEYMIQVHRLSTLDKMFVLKFMEVIALQPCSMEYCSQVE